MMIMLDANENNGVNPMRLMVGGFFAKFPL